MLGSRAMVVVTCWAFSITPARLPAQTNEALAAQLSALAGQISALRQELADTRRESAQLRDEMRQLRSQVAAPPATTATPPAPAAASAVTAEEDRQMLTAKVEEHHQTKVESSSQYRVKLFGMALFTGALTRGAVNSLDLPERAVARQPGDSNGALGATMRQSILGLDVSGPKLAGARTRGEIRADFFGGMPDTSDGAATGFVRLRTARLALDWERDSVEVGVDAPFFSPRSPTSLVSSAYPALWSAGNLWAWTPQIHATHRRRTSGGTGVTLQYGLLDPLTGEPPVSEYDRTPSAGERTRTPAFATRAALEHPVGDRQASAGAGFYVSRQNWGFARRVNAWAATADWELPLGQWFALSGELYRGRSIAGLGGGASASILMDGPLANATTRIRPVDTAGGWTQFQFKPSQRWSFNAAFGGDFPFRVATNMIGTEDESEAGYSPRRNSSGLLNAIYQPRNNLMFSVEYRKLWTLPFGDIRRRANHVSIGAAVFF